MKKIITALCLSSIWIATAEEPAFSFATPDRKLSFPEDHGNHPDFKIEWWYLTGHLFDKSGQRYGFESTFFRLGQKPGEPIGASQFDTSHIYMAHMAMSDPGAEEFYHEERFNREGWNAWSKTGDLDVRNGSWTLKRNPDDGVLSLFGSIQSKVDFTLVLEPLKPHVIFGENGVSRKGRSESAASYYITWPRLEVSGILNHRGREIEVTGSAWMDHEISSSQLEADQTGWDWVSIQFDDGRELMAYMLRLKDGGYSPYSKMVWIDQGGGLIHQKTDEFQWVPGGPWHSNETGATYPIRPKFTTTDPATGKQRTFQIVPLMEKQEMTGKLGGVPYWEGACDVTDDSGKTVGKAYLELAGYVDGLSEKLR